MLSKKLSVSTTTGSTSLPHNRPSSSLQAGLLQQNKLLQLQIQTLRNKLNHTKTEMLAIYEENLGLRELLGKGQGAGFVRDCEMEMGRLRGLVAELSQARYVGATEREEIKDRIIIKLEDQIISLKIQLKQQKYKHNRHSPK